MSNQTGRARERMRGTATSNAQTTAVGLDVRVVPDDKRVQGGWNTHARNKQTKSATPKTTPASGGIYGELGGYGCQKKRGGVKKRRIRRHRRTGNLKRGTLSKMRGRERGGKEDKKIKKRADAFLGVFSVDHRWKGSGGAVSVSRGGNEQQGVSEKVCWGSEWGEDRGL